MLVKRLIFILIICGLIHTVAVAQRNPSSTTELAGMIDQRYPDSAQKVFAAYNWVTSNIRYDSQKAFVINNSTDPRAVIDVAFKRRAGVCENFAAIFVDLCQQMGLRAVVVEGYGIQNNLADRVAHSWAAVNLDNDWFLFDPTWDAGRNGRFSFYKKTGEEFISTHRPFDPMWQMVSYPKIDREARSTAYFHYRDSIKLFLSMDSLHRFETALQRVRRTTKPNDLAETHQKVLNNNLEIQRQEQQMEWYGRAVDLMNEVGSALNEFIDLRNEQFSSVKEEARLKKLLTGLDLLLDSAQQYLTRVDGSPASLVYGTQPAREQLTRLDQRLKEQKNFLEKYLVADLYQRKKMF